MWQLLTAEPLTHLLGKPTNRAVLPILSVPCARHVIASVQISTLPAHSTLPECHALHTLQSTDTTS